MNIKLTNPNEFLKSEFINRVEIQGYKTYSQEAVKKFTNAYKGLIQKAELEELSEVESVQMKIFKAELESLKKVTVVNDDLTKEVLFYRNGSELTKALVIEQEFEKSKAATIGEVHTWGGKKYKKTGNGKWVEVSEHGMSKKEHKDKEEDHYNTMSRMEARGYQMGEETRKFNDSYSGHKTHKEQAEKLSDKEHSDEEVGLGNKK